MLVAGLVSKATTPVSNELDGLSVERERRRPILVHVEEQAHQARRQFHADRLQQVYIRKQHLQAKSCPLRAWRAVSSFLRDAAVRPDASRD